MVYLTFGQILLYAKFVLGTLEEVPHEVATWLPCGFVDCFRVNGYARERMLAGFFLRNVREVFGTCP